MANRLAIGEFEHFVEGVQIAEINGNDVVRCALVLSGRPPYRDASEAGLLCAVDLDEAMDLAASASCIDKLALDVGELEPSAYAILVSKTGALAIRLNDGTNGVADEVIEQVEQFDNGNMSAFSLVQPPQWA